MQSVCNLSLGRDAQERLKMSLSDCRSISNSFRPLSLKHTLLDRQLIERSVCEQVWLVWQLRTFRMLSNTEQTPSPLEPLPIHSITTDAAVPDVQRQHACISAIIFCSSVLSAPGSGLLKMVGLLCAGFVSDVDIESEAFKWMGGARFTVQVSGYTLSGSRLLFLSWVRVGLLWE